VNALEKWASAHGWGKSDVLSYLNERAICSDNCVSLAEVVNAAECLKWIESRLWSFKFFVRHEKIKQKSAKKEKKH